MLKTIFQYLSCESYGFDSSPRTSINQESHKANGFLFVYIKPKKLQTDEDFENENEVVAFNKLDPVKCTSDDESELQEEIEETVEVECSCMKCSSKIECVALPCLHYFCVICICNQLEILCEEEKIEPMRCVCGGLIPTRTFEALVSEETLIEYLEKTKKLNPKDYLRPEDIEIVQNLKECWVCGVDHLHYTCIEMFRENKNKENLPKCMICKYDSDFSLTCGHLLCKLCLKSQVKCSLDNEPFKAIQCLLCTNAKTIIPIQLLYESFGGKDSFVEYQQLCIENTYLSPEFECKICMSHYQVYQLITLDCEHRFCYSCIRQYIISKIANNEVQSKEMVCPSCIQPIDSNVIKANVPEDTFNRYLGLTIMGFKPCEKDKLVMKWCYKCDFGMLIDMDQKFFECPNCRKCFCPKCNVYHPNERNCPNIREKEKKELVELVKEKEFLDELMKDALMCPGCRNFVEKNRGCNFIKCGWPKCGVNFCAICKKKLDEAQHYGHFKKSGPFGATCNTTDRINDSFSNLFYSNN